MNKTYVKPVCYILITVYLTGILRRSLQSGTEHTCLIRTPVLTCNPIVVFDTAIYFPYNRPHLPCLMGGQYYGTQMSLKVLSFGIDSVSAVSVFNDRISLNTRFLRHHTMQQ